MVGDRRRPRRTSNIYERYEVANYHYHNTVRNLRTADRARRKSYGPDKRKNHSRKSQASVD